MEKVNPVVETKYAYYIAPKSGGFLLRKVTIVEDVVLVDENISDPDAWDQVISILEQELGRKFQ